MIDRDLKKAKFLPKKLTLVFSDTGKLPTNLNAVNVQKFNLSDEVWNKKNALKRADIISIMDSIKIDKDVFARRAYEFSHEAGCVWIAKPSKEIEYKLIDVGFQKITDNLFQKMSGTTPEEYGQSYIERWGDVDFLANDLLAGSQILNHTPNTKDKKTMNIIDVGCLNGYMMECLRRSGANNIYGTDISYFLAIERNLNPSFLPNITVGDFSENNYPSHSFDMTVCMEVLEHIPPALTKKFIYELARITKKDGILPISTSEDWFVDETHINCRNRAEWYYEFAKQGLVAEGVQVIFPGFNSFVVRRSRSKSENLINRIRTGFVLLKTGRLKRPEGR